MRIPGVQSAAWAPSQPPSDLAALIEQVRTDAWHQCGVWSRRARRWRSWSVALAIVSALGSGAAGATVAASGSLSSTERAVIAILAFAGAALSGVAAAVGAPSRATNATLRSDRLAAFHRWAGLALVDLPHLPDPPAHDLVRELLAWRDEIFGIEAPPAVRTGREKNGQAEGDGMAAVGASASPHAASNGQGTA